MPRAQCKASALSANYSVFSAFTVPLGEVYFPLDIDCDVQASPRVLALADGLGLDHRAFHMVLISPVRITQAPNYFGGSQTMICTAMSLNA